MNGKKKLITPILLACLILLTSCLTRPTIEQEIIPFPDAPVRPEITFFPVDESAVGMSLDDAKALYRYIVDVEAWEEKVKVLYGE